MHHGQSTVREAIKAKKLKKGGHFLNFSEIGGICSLDHWLRGMNAPASIIQKEQERGNIIIPMKQFI